MSWMSHCLVCSAIRKGGHGLFCGNYLLELGNYPPCRSVWWGECYRESPNDNFPGWTTCKASQTWKLMQLILKVVIDVAGMGITLWGLLLTVISAPLEM